MPDCLANDRELNICSKQLLNCSIQDFASPSEWSFNIRPASGADEMAHDCHNGITIA